MRGVLDMWASYPLWERADEAAYKLTLKRLDQTPRADKFPPPPVARDVQTGSIKRPSADVGGPKVKRDTSIFDIIMGN